MAKSIATQGRTLDHAAFVYDLVEPMILLGKEKRINQRLISLPELSKRHRLLDVGCGTGVLTHMISQQLKPGGRSIISDMHTPTYSHFSPSQNQRREISPGQ